jgi:hypothetical protein
VHHEGPSTVGIDTLFKSRGQISALFLRDCGVPEPLISYQHSLVNALEPIQFYSCFISYNKSDEALAQRIHSYLQCARLRVWFAPEDMQGGRKIYEQVEQAISVCDKLLLLLSPRSMASNWVRTEIRKARDREAREGHQMLFPIRACSMSDIVQWTCFDSDSGIDLAAAVREYHIIDFSEWEDPHKFEAACSRLLRDLKTVREVTVRGLEGPI